MTNQNSTKNSGKKRSKYGVHNPIPHEVRLQALAMRSQGMKMSEIGRLLEMSVSRVSSILTAYGMSRINEANTIVVN